MFILSEFKAFFSLIIVGMLGLGCFYIYHKGYDSAQSLYEGRLQAIAASTAREVAKEQEANQAAIKTTLAQLTNLQVENDNLNKELSDADVKAAADFNAKRACLGVASVRRLNVLGKSKRSNSSKASSTSDN